MNYKKDQIPEGEDYIVRPQTPEERERLDATEDVPEYRIQMKLVEEQKTRLTDSFFLEFDALKREREDLGLEKKWKERDSQYDGTLEPNKQMPFNLHMHQSKIKTDAIVRAIKEAFLDSEPIVDISPRPEASRNDGYVVARKQAEFIDYVMDEEVKMESAFDKVAKSAVKKFVGIMKLCWAYRRETRKREESYQGENIPLDIVNGNLVIKNEGLEQFLKVYPDAMDKHKALVKQLMEEKKIDIVVRYKDTIENNAKPKYVKVEDFYVRNATDYWDGLRTEHCVVERVQYTYWELLKKQDEGEFENIEALFNSDDTQGQEGEGKLSPDYKTATYDILEGTYYFKLKETDKEEVKIKCWFGEQKKAFLGAILFPYYAFDIDYIPFYVELNDYGFYGDARSVMSNLRDSNIAQNVLLNLALYGLYIRNSLTPIVKEGSEVEAAFTNKTWRVGDPLVVDELTDDVNKAMDFVQWPNVDMNTTLVLMEMLKRNDSDVTKVSDLTSGRESVIDPSAPASKTIALLEQSGLGVKEYIRTFLPSFNILCTMLLQLYYQMSQEGHKYKVRRKAEGVTGEDPFASISRDEMIVKTNVQARASSFVFDKVNEKAEAIAALNLVSNYPYAMQQPEIQYESFKIVMETMGQKWRNLVDKMLGPEEFKKQQMMIAMQAVQALMQQAQTQAKVTGVSPDIGMEQVADTVTQAQMVAHNPALAEPKK